MEVASTQVARTRSPARAISFRGEAMTKNRAFNIALALTLLWGLSAGANAQTFVDCTTGTNALSTAVTGLAGPGPHDVVITAGPCEQEVAVRIEDHNGLTIRAQTGTVTIHRTLPGADPNPNVISVFDSLDVRFEGLQITGGQNAVVSTNSRLHILNCTLSGNLVRGLAVLDDSKVDLGASTIQNNGQGGIQVAGSVLSAVGITVQDNGGIAINLFDSRGTIGDFETPSYVRNHPVQGIRAFGGSTLTINGPIEISNNGGVGVNISLGSFGSISGGGDGTTLLPTIIEGHTVVGIQVLGQATIASPLIVRNNGSMSDISSGILVGSGLLFTSSGGGADLIELTSNNGDGLRVSGGGSVQLAGGFVITGNARDGIRLVRNSTTDFFQSPTLPLNINGNAGRAVTCDNSSLISGDLTGIAPLKCTIAKEP